MDKLLLKEILDRIQHVKIAVLGDFCLDAYWFIDQSGSEISIETGLATQTIRHQKYSLGGAGNVTSNLSAMGVKNIFAFGVVGPDPFGTEMKDIMKKTGINTDNILVQEANWSTHVYTKPYVGDEELGRIDFGNFNQLSEKTADTLIQNFEKVIPGMDVIIINQQVLSGIHTPYFRKELVKAISRHPDKIFISDSRNYSGEYTGTWRKMNDTEAARQCYPGKTVDDMVSFDEVHHAAGVLFERFGKPLLITRGARGSLTVDTNGITDVPGLLIIAKVDTVGAGDSYLAGSAAALGAGYGLNTAAMTGTFVAGVTVQKLFQTGTASPEEILAIGNDPDFVYNSELAEDIRHASYLPDSEIEIIKKWEIKPEVQYAIFDHDGTISTLREGWENIMQPMMIKAVLGHKYNDVDEALFRKVEQRVADYIDKTTGIQTLVQMKGLLGIIREFNCVPENEMLDEFGYKEIYNEELLKMVHEREKKLKKGELTVDDFTVKGAVSFLKALYDSGIKLYLASGTDVEDVKKEAAILGYDSLFEGRIYGAVGDISVEAKKIVLDRILNTIGESAPGKIVTFGDGPVEIRETRKRGGITIGIASNEMKRFSLNEGKRSRLIKAGADVIIPDLSQYKDILKLLNS